MCVYIYTIHIGGLKGGACKESTVDAWVCFPNVRRWWPVDLKRIIAPIAKHGGTIPEKISTPLFHIGRATRESKMSSAITRFSCYSPDTFSTGILVADGVSMDIFFLENNHKNGGWWWWGLGKRHSEALSAKAETRMIISAAAAAAATMTTAMVAILNSVREGKTVRGRVVIPITLEYVLQMELSQKAYFY